MTDPINQSEINKEMPQKRIFAEARGKYSLVDGPKMFSFEFPAASNLAENYAAISFLRDEIWKAMEEQKKAEEEKKEEPTTEK